VSRYHVDEDGDDGAGVADQVAYQLRELGYRVEYLVYVEEDAQVLEQAGALS